MKWKLMHEANGQREFVLIFDVGDEVSDTLRAFAREQNLSGSHFVGIGAFSDLVLGYFDWQCKEYERITLDAQVEVLTFTGDVATGAHGPAIHAHVVVGKRDGTAHGGHLLEAHVRPTLEVVLTEMPARLRRTQRPEFGLSLIDVA